MYKIKIVDVYHPKQTQCHPLVNKLHLIIVVFNMMCQNRHGDTLVDVIYNTCNVLHLRIRPQVLLPLHKVMAIIRVASEHQTQVFHYKKWHYPGTFRKSDLTFSTWRPLYLILTFSSLFLSVNHRAQWSVTI